MIPKWAWLFGTGVAWVAFFTGLMFGDVGREVPASTVGVGGVIIMAIVTGIPLLIGIHTGVLYMRGKVCQTT
jgi:hypothetical protein